MYSVILAKQYILISPISDCFYDFNFTLRKNSLIPTLGISNIFG